MFVRPSRFAAAAALAAVLGVLGCDHPLAPTGKADLNLLVVSGSQQTGAAGAQLAEPLVVKVTKPNGAPVRGAVVNFRVAAGGGSVYAGAALTDEAGLAHDLWTLGTRAGDPQRVEVRAVNAQGEALNYGTFTATSVAGAPGRIVIVRGNGQTVPPNNFVETPPTVRVTDQFGNPTAGVPVTFVASFGTVSPPVGTTDTRGLASTSWRVPGIGGSFGIELTATAAGSGISGNPATFTALAVEGGFWQFEAPLPMATTDLATAAVDGKLYALGGMRGNGASSMNVMYDPRAQVWVTRASLPTARRSPGAAQIDDLIYVAGGHNEQLNDGVRALDVYNPATDTWTTRAPMPEGRHQVLVAAINGILYVAGGIRTQFGQVSTRLDAYDPATDTWTQKASMPLQRRFGAAAALGGLLYVVGGTDENFATMATVQVYDPQTDTWSVRADMPQARQLPGATSAFGLLYVLGGHDENFTMLNSVSVYNPATNVWSSKPSMPTARYGFGAAMVGGSVYVVAGLNFGPGFSGPIDRVESFLP